MALADDLKSEVGSIFSTSWERRKGAKVPEADDLKLSNDAVEIEGVVLYTDLVDSSGLVSRQPDWFAAIMYKAFLRCACRVIEANGGVITAFDGDRVMAVFMGETRWSIAARCGLQISHCAAQIINEEIPKRWTTDYRVKHVTGIDSGKLFVTRTGVRGANDLVWVNSAANRAARLSSLRGGGFSSIITKAVYDRLDQSVRLGGANKVPMWTEFQDSVERIPLYGSGWQWKP